MENKCPFCGSHDILVKNGKWKYEGMELVEQEDFCCLSQKRNAMYASRHRNKQGNKPSPDEVAEL